MITTNDLRKALNDTKKKLQTQDLYFVVKPIERVYPKTEHEIRKAMIRN